MLHPSKTPDESGNYNHPMRVTLDMKLVLHASKTPDESGNYNHPVRVTYRYEISIIRL